MKINFNINLTRKQKEAYDIMHDKETQFLIARWSRQCGKTVFAEIMMIEYLCKPNSFNAYISPTFAQGKKVFAELTFPFILISLPIILSFFKLNNSNRAVCSSLVKSFLYSSNLFFKSNFFIFPSLSNFCFLIF